MNGVSENAVRHSAPGHQGDASRMGNEFIAIIKESSVLYAVAYTN
jgi:hypothetical protein